jgi:thiosulfate reductase cytochrome b subunit
VRRAECNTLQKLAYLIVIAVLIPLALSLDTPVLRAFGLLAPVYLRQGG